MSVTPEQAKVPPAEKPGLPRFWSPILACLVLVGVVGSLFVVLREWAQRHQTSVRRRSVIHWVESRGGRVVLDADKSIRSVHIEGRYETDTDRFVGHKIDDLSTLEGLKEVRELKLQSTEADLAPIVTMTDLELLTLYYPREMDLTPLQEMAGLRQLVIVSSVPAANHIESISKLTQLRSLHIDFSSLNRDDFIPLCKLTNLQELKLRDSRGGLNDSRLWYLPPLDGLGNLTKLDIARTAVADLSPLKVLKRLRSLNISGTYVEDISPLESLSELEVLDMRAPVSDLSPLTKLRKLRVLSLYLGNKDLSVILQLSSLEEIRLSDYRERTQQIEEIRAALPNCKVTVE